MSSEYVTTLLDSDPTPKSEDSFSASSLLSLISCRESGELRQSALTTLGESRLM